jgi:hypothetical protein
MAGKRAGKYVLRDHPSVKGLVNVFWQPIGAARPDPRPLVTLGASAVPLLAEALAEWALAHHDEPPEQSGGLRVVGGSR